MRQMALIPVIKRRSCIGEFVKHADEDQIHIPLQVAARNQKIGNTDDQHKCAEQRQITANRRQLVADAQCGKRAFSKKHERDA